MKVFLGGTVADSKWRDYMMPKLDIDYFNPVVEEWTEADMEREIHEREHCNFCLYVISPKMIGWYSLAEVIDDSLKKSDKTIYCFLPKDEDDEFTDEQIAELKAIGKMAQSNGAIWKHSLDEIISFLNSANQQDKTLIYESNHFNNVFISYGRRHSLALAHKLYNSLKQAKFDIWFDMNDIPLGVDFQEQIDEGIKKADNFIFVISPHSVNSVYCYKEIVLALKYNKRIIPIIHVEPTDCWDKMHPVIGKLNWIYLRQNENFDIPIEKWEFIDDYQAGIDGLVSLLSLQRDYVRDHTVILDKAIQWVDNKREDKHLIYGDEYEMAYAWLKQKSFKNDKGDEIQAPCFPTALQAEFISTSKQEVENFMTNSFFTYSKKDFETKDMILSSLDMQGITTWSDTTDMKSGENYKEATLNGIIEADNYLFLISPDSVVEPDCLEQLDIAIKYEKRIIPLLIETTKKENIPAKLNSLQQINIIDRSEAEEVSVSKLEDVEADIAARKGKTPYEKSIDDLVKQIEIDVQYYYSHKILLVDALQWEKKQTDSLLLHSFALEEAKIWNKLGKEKRYKPTVFHEKFLEESISKAGTIEPNVFISYAKKDTYFAEKLNLRLKNSGQTTWFDHQSIPVSLDYKDEIFKGIDQSDNFLFIISPYSIHSPACIAELDYATGNNKRIITLLLTDIEESEQPKNIHEIKPIDAKNQTFHKAFQELLQALNDDREYLRGHTKYTKEAIEWEKNNRLHSLLLRGESYSSSKKWFNDSIKNKKDPKASELHESFFDASKKAITRRKQFTGLGIAILSVVLLLTVWALNQTRVATQKEQSIKEILGQVDRLGEISEQNNNGELLTAQIYISKLDLNVVERTSNEIKSMVLGFVKEITSNNYEKNNFELESSFTSIKYNQATKRLLAADEDGSIHVLHNNGKPIKKWLSGGSTITNLTWDLDGKSIVAIIDDTKFVEWTDKGEKVSEQPIDEGTYLLKLNQDGKFLVTVNLANDFIKMWKSEEGKFIKHREIKYEQFYSVTNKTIEYVKNNGNLSETTIERLELLLHKDAAVFKDFEKFLEEVNITENFKDIKNYFQVKISLDFRPGTNELIFSNGTGKITHSTDKSYQTIVNSPGVEFKQVSFRAMNDEILAMDDGFIYYYNLDGTYTGLYEARDFLGDLKFCSCGHTLAYRNANRIGIVEDNEFVGPLSTTEFDIYDFDIISDKGELVTVESDSTLRFWDLEKFGEKELDSKDIAEYIKQSKIKNYDYFSTHSDEFEDSVSYFGDIQFQKKQIKSNDVSSSTNNTNSIPFGDYNKYIVSNNVSKIVAYKSEFSISGWFKPTASNKDGKQVKGLFGLTNNFDCEFFVAQSKEDELVAKFALNDSAIYEIKATGLKINEWQHIALSYNRNELKLYLDGKEVGTAYAKGVIRDSNIEFNIGAIYSNKEYKFFNGLIDEVCLWDKSLNETELSLIMKEIPKEDNKKPKCYWSFDEDGTTIVDQISNLNAKLLPHRTCNVNK